MMNMKNNILDIWKVAAVMCCLNILFWSCSQDDMLNTNPLDSKETTVKAFGPNPALRGQKLTFAGTHLDKITKVILPNGIEITDIEVVNDKLIKVFIPQETVPGSVKLIGPGGKEFSFSNTLEISEPIEISSMSPQPVKAGQKLTLEGNYFNLITKVIFTDKVEVLSKDFITHQRTKIELTLPAEAQTGVIILADDAEIPLEYQSSEVLQVVLPSVDQVLDLTGKKPGDAVEFPGKDLDLVVKVVMPNGKEVPFTVENNILRFTLADDISDGAIVMIPASGVNVVVANIGVAFPDNVEVTPTENLRVGDEITIKGINLELITGIVFPGVDNAVAPVSQTATEIKVLFPEKAVSGEMILNTASGKTVAVDISTQKPEVQEFNPAPASAGADVVLKGKNLDLITSVTFADELVVEVTPVKADELAVRIPLNALSGTLILTMANGETVTTTELQITAPEFAYLPDPPGPKAEIHAGGVLTVQVENGAKLTGVHINGVTVNYIVDAPNLYIVIPNDAKGATELKLISSNGEAVYTIPVIGAGIVETIVYQGIFALNWSDPLPLDKAVFESVPAGSRLKIYMAATGGGASIAYNDATWNKFTIDDPNFSAQWGTISVPEGSTSYEIVLTAEILNGIRTISDGWSNRGLMFTGAGVVVSKVSIIVGTEPEETELFKGSQSINWGDNIMRFDKAHFEDARGGSILKFYFTPGASPSFALQDANWAKLEFPEDPNFSSQYGSITVPAGETTYEVVLSGAILDRVLTVDDGWSSTAIIMGGADMTVTRVTVIKK